MSAWQDGSKVKPMKRNMVPLLGIAFVAAIIATGVVYGLFGGKLRGKAPEVAGQSIVVAARDLERGAVIKPEDLQLSQVKGGLRGSYSKKEEVVGATLLEPVQKDEPLLERRVASFDPKAGGAGDGIAPGMRAVSVRVTESSGLMGLLRGGSRVDLQAVTDRNDSTELRTILQNVEVLRVNPQLEPTATSRLPLPIATMLVPEQYADLIALADAARASASYCGILWTMARRPGIRSDWRRYSAAYPVPAGWRHQRQARRRVRPRRRPRTRPRVRPRTRTRTKKDRRSRQPRIQRIARFIWTCKFWE